MCGHCIYLLVEPPPMRLHEHLPELECTVNDPERERTTPQADADIEMYCAKSLACAISNPAIMRSIGNVVISYTDSRTQHSYTSNSAVINYKVTADKGDVRFMDRTKHDVYHAQVELLCYGRHEGDAWGDAAVNHAMRNAMSPDFAWPLATICCRGDGKDETDRLLGPVVPMMAPLRKQGGLEMMAFLALPPILYNEDGTIHERLEVGNGPQDFDRRLRTIDRTPFTAHGIISMDMKGINVFCRTHYATGVKSSCWHNTLHEDQVRAHARHTLHTHTPRAP